MSSDPSCYNVDVYSDALYCTAGVSEQTACRTVKNAQAVCPMAGATSLSDSCNSFYNSYVNANECTLQENTTCRELPSGEWGCAYETESYSANKILTTADTSGGGLTNNDDDESSATTTSLVLVSFVVIFANLA